MNPEGRNAVSEQFLAGFSKRSRKVDTHVHTRVKNDWAEERGREKRGNGGLGRL